MILLELKRFFNSDEVVSTDVPAFVDDFVRISADYAQTLVAWGGKEVGIRGVF